jgi:hypothetical protein
MIISASRRTDIPAFYGEWFLRRLEEGWCRVPNPFNPKQVATVSLAPDEVDAFVFWTRDPRPFLPVLDVLDRRGDPYTFLFTITGYGPPLEPGAPARDEAVRAFRKLAARLGPDRVVWRYDPIVFGPGLAVDDHREGFAHLARALEGATRSVKISCVDLYRKTRRRMARLEAGEAYLQDPASVEGLGELLEIMGDEAARVGISIETCAEDEVAESHGLRRGRCIDPDLLERVFGLRVPAAKHRGQRPECGCALSRDIGMNDSCLHGCVYCYATASQELAAARHGTHDPKGATML